MQTPKSHLEARLLQFRASCGTVEQTSFTERAIVELLNDIATTLRELPSSVQGKRDAQDANRYRFLREHWPKDYSFGFDLSGKVFVSAQAPASASRTVVVADTLDEALDAVMPRR